MFKPYDTGPAYVEPVQREFDAKTLRRLNYVSAEMFINTMIPDQLKFPVPEFHKVVLSRLMHGTARQCYALPRGCAKTTLVGLGVVWHLVYTAHEYVLYVSAVHGNAANYVGSIVEILESDNFRAIYGAVDFSKGYKRVTEGDYKFTLHKRIYENKFNVMTGEDELVERTLLKTCYLQCKGARQGVRGLKKGSKRPSLLILDDIEDKELLTTGKSEENYNKLSNWVESTLLKALDTTMEKIIQIGNLVAAKSVLMDNLEDDRYSAMVYGIIKSDGSPLWPELWPLTKIKADYEAYKKKNKLSLWFAEMMNFPRPPGGGLISIDDITFVNAHDHDSSMNQYSVITVDLAASDEFYSHETSVVVHSFNGEKWVNIDGVTKRGFDPIELLTCIVDLAIKWKAKFVGLEAVAFQNILKPIYDYILKLRNINWIEFVKVPARKSKPERISGYTGMMKDNLVALASHRNKTLNQLLKFDVLSKTNDDDEIDAASQLTYMLHKHSNDIQMGFNLQEAVHTAIHVADLESAETSF